MNKLPSTEEEWNETPRPVPLDPDAEDLRLASTYSLKPCPFCGDRSPVAFGLINQRTSIICYRVTCGNYRCNASVQFNSRDRDAAREGALKCWQRRIDRETSG